MESVDLINKRFEEHRRRQGLILTTPVNLNLPRELGQEFDVDVVDVSLDTGNEFDEGHPPTTAYTGKYSGAAGGGDADGVDDKSRKGSVDEKIKDLVRLINSTEDFFTTSTCSGRIILFTNESVESKPSASAASSSQIVEKSVPVKKIKKQGCSWLLVSHDEVTPEELQDAWKTTCSTVNGDVSFKVEAAILHVQCRKLSDAKKLIHAATESGFRNSGMVIGGKDNRITVAVRSALGYEVPLTTVKSDDGTESVSNRYLTYLVEKANEKMRENWRRMEKFTEEFRKTFNISS